MGHHRANRSGSRRSASRSTPPPSTIAVAGAGKRRASRHAASRGPLFRGLPSAPVLAGVAALAISIGGAVSSGTAGDMLKTVSADNSANSLVQASALSGSSQTSKTSLLSGREKGTVSRDSNRDALAGASSNLVAQAEAQARQRDSKLAELAQKAEQQSAKIARNAWQLPVVGYHLTARFGEYGLWSSYHTGLDFAAPTGTPIYAVAGGVVTSAGYDGSYGNKTVITLDDGTELWYCHQNSYAVGVGAEVRSGDLIGYIGSTGNTTGPHLHLEVRPGAGDPVDPYAALVAHGVTP